MSEKYRSLEKRSRPGNSNLLTLVSIVSVLALALAAIAAGFGIRAWYLTPGGGGHGPTYNLKISGELDQTGNIVTLYTTCSNDTGSVQTLRLVDGSILNVYQKCPIPRNQCEMSLCDLNDECTTSLVDPMGCAANSDCESYQECDIDTCTCFNVTDQSSLWNINTNDISVTSLGASTNPNFWSIYYSFWKTELRGNETWVTLNTISRYLSSSTSTSVVEVLSFTSLPLPLDVTNPAISVANFIPGIGSASTAFAAGFFGYVQPTWVDADTIFATVTRTSTVSGATAATTVNILVEYPTTS